MSASVRISARAARALHARLKAEGATDVDERRAFVELEMALRAKPKKALPFPTRKQERAKRKATKKGRRQEIRVEIEARANGCCEACGISERFVGPLEWDHFHGRVRVPESVQTGWFLCHPCHANKTKNHPARTDWLGTFAGHCERHGYVHEARRANELLEAAEAKAQLAGVGA